MGVVPGPDGDEGDEPPPQAERNAAGMRARTLVTFTISENIMGFAAPACRALYLRIPPELDVLLNPSTGVSQKMNETAETTRSNRRITARKACLLTVRYKADGAWRPATAMDLSPYGCRLRVGEDVPRGLMVAVVFEAPSRDGEERTIVEVPGRAIWARLEGLSFQVGVHFEDPPPGLPEVLAALS